MAFANGMKHDVVPMDQAGRVVLPKSLRQEMAIKPGDTFKVSINGVAVMLTPNKAVSGFVRKGKALVLATDGDERLSEASAQAILDAGRADHDSQSVAAPGSRGLCG